MNGSLLLDAIDRLEDKLCRRLAELDRRCDRIIQQLDSLERATNPRPINNGDTLLFGHPMLQPPFSRTIEHSGVTNA